MALNWNATEVEAFEGFSDEEKQRCALFAFELMAVDISAVTEDNIEELYLRLQIYSRLNREELKYSYQDVLSYVGFRTNVTNRSRQKWLDRQINQLASDMRILTEA